MSLEALPLEAGFRNCPFHHPYKSHGPLMAYCWCRLLWKSLDHYGFHITLDKPEIPLPRFGDQLLVDTFDFNHLADGRRRSLQRCQGAWKSLFLLDLCLDGGRHLDNVYLSPPSMAYLAESEYKFGEEKLCRQD